MHPTVLLLEFFVHFSAVLAYDSWPCDGVTYRSDDGVDAERHHPTGVCTQWAETKSWMLVCYESGSIKQLDWDNVECAGNPTSIKDHKFYNNGYISRLEETVTFIEDVCTCNPCSYGKRTERKLREGELDELDEYVFALNSHCYPIYNGIGVFYSGRDKCTSDGRWRTDYYGEDDCVDFDISTYKEDDQYTYGVQIEYTKNEWYSCGMANNTCSGRLQPSSAPTLEPTLPTTSPTEWPTAPTMEPTAPTMEPTAAPTAPTMEPTAMPTAPSARPTLRPTASPNCDNHCEPICIDDCVPKRESAEEEDEGTGNGCVGFQASRWVFVFAVLALLQ